ncbi:MAG: NUDIX domain-containing protein [Dehalococcoidales bacterium]|nr:NUDIX domain-containing protein [Dehalococcoidales bacterium]
MTAKAIGRILGEFPGVVLHTFWDNMVIGNDGRLVGQSFDAGDYACGGGVRVHFSDDISLRPLLQEGHPTIAIYKVGAIIVRDGHILVVRKDVPDRHEYILPGGKAKTSEEPFETLRRELQEELDVELVNARWFGRFQEDATFENVPLLMDVYILNIKGDPSPHAEIQGCSWIDCDYHKRGILLGKTLERQIIPELAKRGIIS